MQEDWHKLLSPLDAWRCRLGAVHVHPWTSSSAEIRQIRGLMKPRESNRRKEEVLLVGACDWAKSVRCPACSTLCDFIWCDWFCLGWFLVGVVFSGYIVHTQGCSKHVTRVEPLNDEGNYFCFESKKAVLALLVIGSQGIGRFSAGLVLVAVDSGLACSIHKVTHKLHSHTYAFIQHSSNIGPEQVWH
jgi:hypothetical protein